MNLRHDGIVDAYGIYLVKTAGKKSLGLLLDYKKHGDLSRWIPTDGFPEDILKGIMAQICDTMVYLHRIPVVHRDIKPQNVLVDCAPDGLVKVVLADFGLAADCTDTEKLTHGCGTAGFIAPEMFHNNWKTEVSGYSVTDITKID